MRTNAAVRRSPNCDDMIYDTCRFLSTETMMWPGTWARPKPSSICTNFHPGKTRSDNTSGRARSQNMVSFTLLLVEPAEPSRES